MKKLVLVFLLIPAICFGGEFIQTPYDIVISDPLTDWTEKMNIDFKFQENGNHYVVILYRVWNSDKTEMIHEFSFEIRNEIDNPVSNTQDCIAENDPWPLCSGNGTCENDCDETTTDFTDYIAGFGGTLNSRTQAAMNQDLQSRLPTQAKP